jgi:hypothetical protein
MQWMNNFCSYVVYCPKCVLICESIVIDFIIAYERMLKDSHS